MRTEYRLWHWPPGSARGEKHDLYPTDQAAMQSVGEGARRLWVKSPYGGWHIPEPSGDLAGRYQSWAVTAEQVPESPEDRIGLATTLILEYGHIDGDHHKAWVLDQVLRVLAGDRYDQEITDHCAGEDGPDTYFWDEGIAP